MADPYAIYEIQRTEDFNPDTGVSLVLLFYGTLSKMQEIQAYYEAAGSDNPIGYGYKTTLMRRADGNFLTVRIPDDILYTERWNLASEARPIPIWQSERVRDYIPALSGLNWADLTGATQRAFLWRVNVLNNAANSIAAGVSEGTVFQAATPPTGTADLGEFTQEEFNVILQIVREGQYMDWKQPVLRRQRYIPSVRVASRTRLVGPAQLYTLDGIANVFGIPDDNYDQAVTVYDNLPAAYPNTMWSWKLGRDDSDGVTGSGKVLECKEWSFGRWSTITNVFIQ